MLRFLRIFGVLLFAVLIGLAAGRLRDQYQAGTLWSQYNSQRKADITLLVVSVMSVGVLGFFEFLRSKRLSERRGYRSVKLDEEPKVDGLDSTNIYSAPKTVDKWQERSIRTKSRPRRKHFDMNGLWMRMLRVCCMVLSGVYFCALMLYLISWVPVGAGHLVLTIIIPLVLLFSVVTLIGVLRKTLWGMKCGYALAIFHLLIFPFGTVAGLVMLVGLVGAAPEFIQPARQRRQELRKQRLQSA